MKNKILSYSLLACGYMFQYIIPLIMFGYVVPYTHDAKGFTIAFYLAFIVTAFIISGKIKGKIEKQEKSLFRELLLSVFPIVMWAMIGFGIDKVLIFVTSLSRYWWHSLIFIFIGRLFFIIEAELSKESR